VKGKEAREKLGRGRGVHAIGIKYTQLRLPPLLNPDDFRCISPPPEGGALE